MFFSDIPITMEYLMTFLFGQCFIGKLKAPYNYLSRLCFIPDDPPTYCFLFEYS